MIINIGIMQGRLLPRFEDRYQAHPIQIWPSEFLGDGYKIRSKQKTWFCKMGYERKASALGPVGGPLFGSHLGPLLFGAHLGAI